MLHARKFLAPLAFLLAVPAAAQEAAAPPNPCDVDAMSPGKLAQASIRRNAVISAANQEDGMKGVRDALKLVFEKENAANPLGRDYVMAQFAILAIDFGGEVQARGNLNFPGDKNQRIDLVVVADSLLDIVEKEKPLCKEEIAQWREYKPFANRIKMAYDALAAQQHDSAEASARRAIVLSDASPAPYDVLWRLAAAKDDEEGHIRYLKVTVDKLAADTSQGNVRSNLLFNLGRVQHGIAEKATGERKAQMFKAAADAFVEVVQKYPGSQETPFAINSVAVAWALTNDSTDAVRMLNAAMPSIGKMDDVGLFQAASIAVRLNRTADAAELFKAASNVNPYHRDYLYNYAATLFELRRSAEMIPVVTKLVALDPSNPDNVLLFAYAYKGMADSTADAAMKKTYTDSAVAYSSRSDAMRTKVIYERIERGRDNTSVTGEVENRGQAARSYTIEFEFLDSSGNVVEKKPVSVGPVAPNASAQFRVEIAKGGVSGIRYAPIPQQ